MSTSDTHEFVIPLGVPHVDCPVTVTTTRADGMAYDCTVTTTRPAGDPQRFAETAYAGHGIAGRELALMALAEVASRHLVIGLRSWVLDHNRHPDEDPDNLGYTRPSLRANGHRMASPIHGDRVSDSAASCVEDCGACRDGEPVPNW